MHEHRILRRLACAPLTAFSQPGLIGLQECLAADWQACMLHSSRVWLHNLLFTHADQPCRCCNDRICIWSDSPSSSANRPAQGLVSESQYLSCPNY